MSDEVKAEEKKLDVFSKCVLKKVVDATGKKHIEAECTDKEASHELAELLEQEVIIRVKPKLVTEVKAIA